MTTTILPSRAPYGSPSYSPNSRPVYYGGSTVSGATPAGYALSFATLGLTGTAGYVYDGTVSRAWTDNGATTLASASGSDTIAVFEDMSGNENHATRTTSANRPVFYDVGGIKSAKGGTISGVDRSLALPAIGAGAAFTAYMVSRVTNDGLGGGYPMILAQNGGGFYYFAHETSSGSDWRIFTPSGAGNLMSGGPVPGAAGIFRFDANATTAGSIYLFGKNGVSAGTYTSAANAYAPTPDITSASEWLSAIGASSDHLESPFLFVAMADLVGTAAETTILNYIYDTFGTW